MEPEFGEHSGDVRAEANVFVRRPLNEYSGLDEVFMFSFVEPEVSQAERVMYPSMRYILTRDEKTGRPGVKSDEFNRRLMHPEKVPDEVLERAQEMIRQLDVDPDLS